MGEDMPEKLQRIESKIDSIKKMIRQYIQSEKTEEPILIKSSGIYAGEKEIVTDFTQPSINIYLLKLPDSLRKTMLAMNWLREAASPQVAKVTGRSRSVESFHLNQLERMGYLVKFRKGKKIYFRIPHPIAKEIKKFTSDNK